MRLLFADGLFWTSVACCLVAQLLIIRSVRGARHLPSPTAGAARPHEALELFWALLPAVGLAVLLLLTWRAIHRPAGAVPRPAATVQASPASPE